MSKILATVACAAILVSALPAHADDGGVEVGTLECEQTDRTNLIIWSEAKYLCSFRSETHEDEVYVGEIDKIGVDLTVDKIETMSWTVVAPTDNADPGALVGTYVGASADAAVGAGGGARALVGGGENAFSLQPIALTGQEGFGVAAGIESFKLELANQ